MKSELGAWHAYLGQTGTDWMPACNKNGAARGATLLTVCIGEHHAFFGDPLNIGCPMSSPQMIRMLGLSAAAAGLTAQTNMARTERT